MTKRQPSIKNRVRTVILLSSVAVLVMTVSAFIVYEVISFRHQLVRNLSTLAAVIADNSSAPLAFDQKESAETILSALKAEPNIMAAALYDHKGTLFAKYPTTVGTNLISMAVEQEKIEFRDNAVVLYRPVILEQKAIGTLFLRSSLRQMYERFWRYAAIVAAVLLGSFLVAFVLSTLLQKRISDPIVALTKAAEVISTQKNYSVRAPKLSDDELGTLTDAFNRMLAQTEEHQNRLGEQARLLDLSNDAISVRDADGKITYWNHGSEELYGFTREEALGKVSHDLLRTEYSEPLEKILEKFHHDNRWAGELVQTRKDGIKLFVASRWSLDRKRGRPTSILESNTDISARKAFQAELERLVQERTARLQETIGELEAFSYSISHDMRAPLRAMQGYAKAIVADYGKNLDPEPRQYLDRIARAANRLDLLIQDVLAYSKVAKGDISLHPVDLESLIRDLLPNHPELQPPQASVIIESPLHPVLGHEAYLTQCITNLLGNAVKFVSPGEIPKIRIRTERIDGKVRVWFEDNGIGIDPSHHERIFQIFGQVYPEKKFGGTGIGLAIVRKAVQRMNGEVGVDSQLGKGSRFWIVLEEPQTS